MQDLIASLKKRPQTLEEHMSEMKQEWLKALGALFDDVAQWTKPAVEAGVLKVGHSQTDIQDDELGPYLAPVVTISDQRYSVRFEPVGPRVVGMVGIGPNLPSGFRGLVNMICGPYKVPIVRQTDGSWMVLTMRGEPSAWNEEAFADLLSEVLLDA